MEIEIERNRKCEIREEWQMLDQREVKSKDQI